MSLVAGLETGEPSAPSEVRGVVRMEHWGSTVFLPESGRYLSFDELATRVIWHFSQGEGEQEILQAVRERYQENPRDYETLIKWWGELGLLHPGNVRFLEKHLPSSGSVLAAPDELYLQVTRACNLRCPHCPLGAGAPREGEMSIAAVKSLLEQMASIGCFVLHIMGGEPFVRKDVCEIIAYANNLGIAVNIDTNATKINDRMANNLCRLRVNSYDVAAWAGNDCAYNAATGNSSAFEKFKRGLGNIAALCGTTGSKMCFRIQLRRDIAADLPPIFSLASKNGVKEIKVDWIPPVPGRIAQKRESLMEKADVAVIVRSIEDGARNNRMNVSFSCAVPGRGWCNRAVPAFGEPAGNFICYVASDGKVYPHPWLDSAKFCCGSIREQNLVDIWQNSPVLNDFRRRDCNQGCKSCQSLERCHGGSRVRTLLLGGKLNEADPLCALKQEKANLCNLRMR